MFYFSWKEDKVIKQCLPQVNFLVLVGCVLKHLDKNELLRSRNALCLFNVFLLREIKLNAFLRWKTPTGPNLVRSWTSPVKYQSPFHPHQFMKKRIFHRHSYPQIHARRWILCCWKSPLLLCRSNSKMLLQGRTKPHTTMPWKFPQHKPTQTHKEGTRVSQTSSPTAPLGMYFPLTWNNFPSNGFISLSSIFYITLLYPKL